MKENKFNNMLLAIMAAPIIVFLLFAIVMGLPEQSLFSKPEFYLQTADTMLTIVAIPAYLWFVRRDRIAKPDSITFIKGKIKVTRYQKRLFYRMCFFALLATGNVVLYFLVPNISFFYLAVIIYLSMFFARR